MVIFMYYFNTFLIYSILGYLLETIRSFFVNSKFTSGILYGPWTPIYGIGIVLIVLISNYLFLHLHLSRWLETLITFFLITIILTIPEWLGGILIEKIFHVVFWDYSKEAFSIGKYISLSKSFIWGIGSILFIYVLKPLLDNFIKHVPFFITVILFLVMISDLLVTIVNKTKI